MKERKLSGDMKSVELLYWQLSNPSYKREMKEYLSEREYDILNLYFNQEITYREIGKKYNLSGGRIHQILWKSRYKLVKMDYGLKHLFSKYPLDNLDKTIDTLPLSVRATNCLLNNNIKTIRELVILTENDLLHMRRLGRKTLNEIKERLDEIGLNLNIKLEGRLD